MKQPFSQGVTAAWGGSPASAVDRDIGGKMKIKTSGLDHVHVYVNDLTAFLELVTRLFECDETLQSVVESIGSYNAQVRFPGGAGSPFLDVFQPMSSTGAAAKVIQRHGDCVPMLPFRMDDRVRSSAG